MIDRYSGDRRGWAVVSPLAADRILVGVCAGIWLLLVGISVAAVVALVDLGRGFNTSTGGKHTPAVLYVIIVVSALVIVGAIPLLLHARRTTRANSASRSGMPARRVAGQPIRPGYKTPRPMTGETATERLTTLESATGLSDAEVNRIWLRGTVGLLAAMGVALVAVATATYLMAVGRYGLSWTGYGIAGAITATMPVIVWWHIRQTRRMLAGSSFE